MKKRIVLTTIIALAFVMAGNISAWGASAGFEMSFRNLALRLNSSTSILLPSSVSGYAQVAGWAGSPVEEVPAYLKQPFYGTYNLSSSYQGGTWLKEMTTSGVYDPGANNANTYVKIVSNAPCPGPENINYWGNERGFVNQGAWSVYYLNFTSPQDALYQTHITADYTYTVTLDNSGPNTFGELDWAPELFIGLNPPYWIQPNYDITDIFVDKSPGTHYGHLDLDVGPEVYLFAGNNMKVTLDTSVCTWNWGPMPAPPPVPIPSSAILLSTGIFGLAGWGYKRRSTGR
jgi:hypothetical protein